MNTKLMERKIALFVVSCSLIMIFTGTSTAQAAYKIGDTIYANVFSGGCVRVTVKGTDPAYYVHIEEGSSQGRDTFYNANRIDECKQSAAVNKPAANTQNRGPADNPNMDAGKAIGSRVDVFLSDNKEGKNRGTIVALRGSEYKIRYDGCSEKNDVWENAALVRPAASISPDDPKIRFLLGKWTMTSVGISSDAIAWGKAAGIQINGDGSFVWYQSGGKPPVKGKWTTHARIDGARYGTETDDGILINDALGQSWKLYRRKSTIDNDDHITIRMMCQGTTQMGTRAR